jgi:acetylornithine deacetylase/succinyl-diaminopimelate desuccinylase-like protein
MNLGYLNYRNCEIFCRRATALRSTRKASYHLHSLLSGSFSLQFTILLAVVLFLLLPLLLSMTGCAAHQNPDATPAEVDHPLAVVLSRAIQFETVNPPGDEKPLASYFASLLSDAGIESLVVDTPRGDSVVGRASAWGVVRGTGGKRPVVLLSHLDTVPVDPLQWDDDPFGGIVRDGYVIGRGALDAKGVAVVHLMTMLELAQRETPLDRDVIFLATPDEESGGIVGAGYIARYRADLLGDAEYLLTEGGGILDRADPAPDLWRIGVVEKSPCWMRVTARGKAGHSSVPPRNAAVPRLISALERVNRLELPIRVVPEVEAMYRALAPLAAPEDAAAYRNLASRLKTDTAFRNRFMTIRFQAALVSNTITATVLRGSSRTNVLPAEAIAHLDARLLPGESCDRFTDIVRHAIADPGIRVDPLLSFESQSSPTDTALYAAIRAVAARETPAAPTIPSVTIGFTDAHYFRDLGIASYGFTPRALRREDGRGVHGHNERAAIGPLAEAVTTLLAILDELELHD